MKYSLTLAAVAAALMFTSCEKCADCACSGDIVFEFDENMSQSKKDELTALYTTSFENDANYPETDEEICAKRKEFDDEISGYEDQTYSASQTLSTIDGSELRTYTYTFSYTCTCQE